MEKSNDTVFIGGNEIVVGGWSAYEAEKRKKRWKYNPDSKFTQLFLTHDTYRNRTYIGGQDTLESLINSQENDPLRKSADKLAEVLELSMKQIPTDFTEIYEVINVTPEEILQTKYETDINELHRIAEKINSSNIPDIPNIPPLPSKKVYLSDKAHHKRNSRIRLNKDIIQLEEETIPRAKVVEEYRGKMAALFDIYTDKLKSLLSRDID